MTLRISIEFSERDLRHFRRELRKARAAVGVADDEEILSAARDLAASIGRTRLPDFLSGRFDKLHDLIAMVADADWALGDRERAPVLAALAYLCDPEDLIPDDIPGIGLLDDAVMIELVFHELRHEIAAYRDFSRYRAGLARGSDAPAKLARRRTALLRRIRERQARDRAAG
ncbi:MAG: YkvA family protein [Steroidobacteraceae bacterium]